MPSRARDALLRRVVHVDWLFPTSDARQIVHALNASGANVSFAEIESDKGHDAFLLDEPELFAITRGFIDAAAARARPAAGQGLRRADHAEPQ
jgi:homoserine O-acetyltransferase/O-succinyltransferase